jgi:2-oxoisovalerate dehydrogenase E2 component (dihydrolipoyl transacylase)
MLRRCAKATEKPLKILSTARPIAYRLTTPTLPLLHRNIRPATTFVFQSFHTSRPVLAQPGLPPAKPNAAGILQYRLTDVGEGIAECELIRWFKNEGEELAEFDRLCEVQSDKATVEITSRYSGTITKLHYKVGDMAKVGAPLVDIKVSGWKDEEPATKVPETSAKPSSPAAALTASAGQPANRQLNVDELRGKVLATPAVRHMARQNNLDLATVAGTGRDGRVMREDVVAFLKGGATAAATATATPALSQVAVAPAARQDQVVPIRGVKKIMVKTMTAAALVPHFGYKDEWNVDALIDLRARLKPLAEKRGIKLTFMPIFIKACSLALLQYPELNAHTNADCTEHILRGSHNIGVAMDTPQGLLVPNVKDVQSKSIFDIAAELNRLQALGAEGKLGQADLTGGKALTLTAQEPSRSPTLATLAVPTSSQSSRCPRWPLAPLASSSACPASARTVTPFFSSLSSLALRLLSLSSARRLLVPCRFLSPSLQTKWLRPTL